jgi:O-antigen/teichoic acid export membrane protein
MVQGTLATLAVVAQSAAGFTATKYLAEFRATDRRRAGNILGLLMIFSTSLAGIAAIGLLVASDRLADSVLNAPDLGPTLAIGSVVLLFAVLNGVLIGAPTGLR